jgi:hypothetical protein
LALGLPVFKPEKVYIELTYSIILQFNSIANGRIRTKVVTIIHDLDLVRTDDNTKEPNPPEG